MKNSENNTNAASLAAATSIRTLKFIIGTVLGLVGSGFTTLFFLRSTQGCLDDFTMLIVYLIRIIFLYLICLAGAGAFKLVFRKSRFLIVYDSAILYFLFALLFGTAASLLHEGILLLSMDYEGGEGVWLIASGIFSGFAVFAGLTYIFSVFKKAWADSKAEDV
ncbi:hypothetical protein [Sedimentisphaera salicampi]|uniref:Uncharacterized protein n=1 Tax=Sedimentisphaera salicampi TaxID=1941349 RepID=A0A1W6LMQ1_9BACT|nr:hypothetical protein [Sedimentisphaera salicampi]ARN57055.1 hypothetical protein STSP1_01450 [Sedimentisphaera salicampi]